MRVIIIMVIKHWSKELRFPLYLILWIISIATGTCSLELSEFPEVDTNQVIIIKEADWNNAEDYFGLSVSLAKGESNSGNPGWIFIGAPKSNLTDGSTNYQPGVVWRCNLGGRDVKCEPLDFTRQNCDKYNKINYYNQKFATCDSSFTGGSIAFQEDTLVTCAPNWRREREPTVTRTSNGLRMDGACYWMGKGDALRPDLAQRLGDRNARIGGNLIPFRDQEFNDGRGLLQGILRWYFAVTGHSSHVTPQKDIILGAPGVLGGSGSVLVMNSNRGYSDWSLLAPEAYRDAIQHTYTLSHLGYVVTSGTYENSRVPLIAASAPRSKKQSMPSNDMTGAVVILNSAQFRESKRYYQDQRDWHHIHRLEGEHFGDYFGAALESVDLNKDGLEELLVGAPYSDTGKSNGGFDGDHGCVYIYSQKGQQNFNTNPTKICGNVPGGRFGTAIAKIGDINQDTYEDFAVGAPYEDNSGAVYLFYGRGTLGGKALEVHKISGRSYIPSPVAVSSGFGYSLSGGVDIDENGTPDFAVGSYLSKQAVIFRTRPGLQIFSDLTFGDGRGGFSKAVLLDPNATTFEMRLQVYVRITPLPNPSIRQQKPLRLHGEIKVDKDHQRFLVDGATTHSFVLSYQQANTRISQTFIATRTVLPSDLIAAQPEILVQYSVWYNETKRLVVLPMEISIKPESKPAETRINGQNFQDFCSSCPFPTHHEISSNQLPSVAFRRECKRRSDRGNFPICMPKLTMNISGHYRTPLNSLHQLGNVSQKILGETPEISFHFNITNWNQIAYFPHLRISWSWYLGQDQQLTLPQLIQWDDNQCNNFGNATADCPLRIGTRTYILKRKTATMENLFDLSKIVPTGVSPSRLGFKFEAYLEGDDYFETVKDTFTIDYSIDATIIGVDSFLNNQTWPTSSELSYSFTVRTIGITPAKLNLKFFLPQGVSVGGKSTQILEIRTPHIQGMTCTDLDPKTDRDASGYLTTAREGATNERWGADRAQGRLFYGLENIKGLACSMITPGIGNWTQKFEFKAMIKDEPATRNILKDGPLFLFGMGKAQMFNSDHRFNVSKLYIYPPKEQGIAAWIVIAAGVGGFILLFLVVLCLCKCGFFKRSTKEKLELLKAEADVEDAEQAIQDRYEDASPQVASSSTSI